MTNMYHQASLHIAKLICNYPLTALSKCIETENIDGEYLLKENDYSFIQQYTGCTTNDAEQIKAVILKHKVKTNSQIYADLDKELMNKFDGSMTNLFMLEIKNIDLEVMQLKHKRGYQIHDEAEQIMDIVQEIQNKQKK
eukprot:506354_1